MEHIGRTSSEQGDEWSKVKLLTNSLIDGIIEEEVEIVFCGKLITRSTRLMMNEVKIGVLEIRQKRLEEESHLPSSFADDVRRSKIELRFVLQKICC